MKTVVELYGSRRWGNAQPDSDWDFLVYMGEESSPEVSYHGHPYQLDDAIIQRVRSMMPAGVVVGDVFVAIAREGKWCALLYDLGGRMDWDDCHGCPGGWLPSWAVGEDPPRGRCKKCGEPVHWMRARLDMCPACFAEHTKSAAM